MRLKGKSISGIKCLKISKLLYSKLLKKEIPCLKNSKLINLIDRELMMIGEAFIQKDEQFSTRIIGNYYGSERLYRTSEQPA